MSGPATDLELIIKTGSMAGTRISVGGSRMSVGRDGTCDIKLEDPRISRIHGYFETANGKLYFRDNNSTNGSKLNGAAITGVHELKASDLVQLGGIDISVEQQSDSAQIAMASNERSEVTSSLKLSAVTGDALAQKFSQIFEYYKDHQPETSPLEQVDLVKTQRLVNSLKTLYAVTTKMSQLLPQKGLLRVVSAGLFEVFAGAENLVILLLNEETEEFEAVHSTTRDGNESSNLRISRTILNRAINDRATLVANDVSHDARFSASESIVGLSVKSVICAPLVIGDIVIGAMYLDNRISKVDYDEMDTEIVTAFANQAAIALDNARLCDTLQESYHQMLQSLLATIEAKDKYTIGHTQRVREYAMGIAEELGIHDEHLRRVGVAAELHDIGKIGIAEGLINKSGSLTDGEYEDLKEHVLMGIKILKPIVYLQDVLPWIRGHHEKWDGTGYPDGLIGEDCPLEARVLAVADAFDAMTSQRAYNKPLTFEQAMQRIIDAKGRHFDPRVADAFCRYLKRRTAASEEHKLSDDFEAEPYDSSSVATISPIDAMRAARKPSSGAPGNDSAVIPPMASPATPSTLKVGWGQGNPLDEPQQPQEPRRYTPGS
ncbi:MAG: HD domain-containing protein [Candidatus Sumerlaeia bacterium]|nr:HD domain-containing protein [Candidatus Sumerlaeia bacterium]